VFGAALLTVGCEDRANTVGRMEAFLFDKPVACELAKDRCLTREQPPTLAVPEHAAGRAFSSTSASRHSPGLYLYFEFIRPSGVVAQVEVDLPTSQGSDPSRSYLKYQEYKDGVLTFSSNAATGSLLLPDHMLGASGRDCACEDGLLELLFFDHGPDNKPGTRDDMQRRLSRLRYSREPSYYCRTARLQEVKERVQIGVLFDCPGTHYQPAPSGGGSYYDTEAELGCAAPHDDSYYEDYQEEETGCGGDYESGSEYDASDDGCEGDYSDSSSGGCEGDYSSSSSSSADCEGGGDYDTGGCEGDAYAAIKRPRRRGGRWQRAFGLLLPLVVLGALHGALRRRRRRRPLDD